MTRLIVFRLWQTLLALFLISVLAFALLAAVGGDALTALRSDPHTSEETLRRLSRIYALDQPLAVRYARWASQLALRGDFGYSVAYQSPVWPLIRPRLFRTLILTFTAFGIAAALALALAALGALRPHPLYERFVDFLIVTIASAPRLVLALATLALLVTALSHSPSGTSSGADETGLPPAWRRLWPAAAVLSFPLIALFLAHARDALRAALSLEYVRVARAKGLGAATVLRRHALRAALAPLITVFGQSLGNLMSGSVIVETILDWPGLGQLSVGAVRGRDAPLLLGIVLLTSLTVLASSALSDCLLYLNDPRLHHAARGGARGGNAV